MPSVPSPPPPPLPRRARGLAASAPSRPQHQQHHHHHQEEEQEQHQQQQQAQPHYPSITTTADGHTSTAQLVQQLRALWRFEKQQATTLQERVHELEGCLQDLHLLEEYHAFLHELLRYEEPTLVLDPALLSQYAVEKLVLHAIPAQAAHLYLLDSDSKNHTSLALFSWIMTPTTTTTSTNRSAAAVVLRLPTVEGDDDGEMGPLALALEEEGPLLMGSSSLITRVIDREGTVLGLVEVVNRMKGQVFTEEDVAALDAVQDQLVSVVLLLRVLRRWHSSIQQEEGKGDIMNINTPTRRTSRRSLYATQNGNHQHPLPSTCSPSPSPLRAAIRQQREKMQLSTSLEEEKALTHTLQGEVGTLRDRYAKAKVYIRALEHELQAKAAGEEGKIHTHTHTQDKEKETESMRIHRLLEQAMAGVLDALQQSTTWTEDMESLCEVLKEVLVRELGLTGARILFLGKRKNPQGGTMLLSPALYRHTYSTISAASDSGVASTKTTALDVSPGSLTEAALRRGEKREGSSTTTNNNNKGALAIDDILSDTRFQRTCDGWGEAGEGLAVVPLFHRALWPDGSLHDSMEAFAVVQLWGGGRRRRRRNNNSNGGIDDAAAGGEGGGGEGLFDLPPPQVEMLLNRLAPLLSLAVENCKQGQTSITITQEVIQSLGHLLLITNGNGARGGTTTGAASPITVITAWLQQTVLPQVARGSDCYLEPRLVVAKDLMVPNGNGQAHGGGGGGERRIIEQALQTGQVVLMEPSTSLLHPPPAVNGGNDLNNKAVHLLARRVVESLMEKGCHVVPHEQEANDGLLTWSYPLKATTNNNTGKTLGALQLTLRLSPSSSSSVSHPLQGSGCEIQMDAIHNICSALAIILERWAARSSASLRMRTVEEGQDKKLAELEKALQELSVRQEGLRRENELLAMAKEEAVAEAREARSKAREFKKEKETMEIKYQRRKEETYSLREEKEHLTRELDRQKKKLGRSQRAVREAQNFQTLTSHELKELKENLQHVEKDTNVLRQQLQEGLHHPPPPYHHHQQQYTYQQSPY